MYLRTKKQNIPLSLILQQVPLSHCLQPVNGGLPFRHCLHLCQLSALQRFPNHIWLQMICYRLPANMVNGYVANLTHQLTSLQDIYVRLYYTTGQSCVSRSFWMLIHIHYSGFMHWVLCNVHDWCLRIRNASWYYPPVRTAWNMFQILSRSTENNCLNDARSVTASTILKICN